MTIKHRKTTGKDNEEKKYQNDEYRKKRKKSLEW
jgi:hypothetical protein